jgi:hypothetical protein
MEHLTFEKIYDIPSEYFKTLDGSDFLKLYTGMTDMDRIFIFMDDSLFPFIKSRKTWLCDGTFKAAPPGFLQVFTIHCSMFEKNISFCYVYMKSKSEYDYV